MFCLGGLFTGWLRVLRFVLCLHGLLFGLLCIVYVYYLFSCVCVFVITLIFILGGVGDWRVTLVWFGCLIWCVLGRVFGGAYWGSEVVLSCFVVGFWFRSRLT